MPPIPSPPDHFIRCWSNLGVRMGGCWAEVCILKLRIEQSEADLRHHFSARLLPLSSGIFCLSMWRKPQSSSLTFNFKLWLNVSPGCDFGFLLPAVISSTNGEGVRAKGRGKLSKGCQVTSMFSGWKRKQWEVIQEFRNRGNNLKYNSIKEIPGTSPVTYHRVQRNTQWHSSFTALDWWLITSWSPLFLLDICNSSFNRFYSIFLIYNKNMHII